MGRLKVELPDFEICGLVAKVGSVAYAQSVFLPLAAVVPHTTRHH